MKRFGVICILILAFMGLADSAYLAQHAADGTPLICNVSAFSDCNKVAESPYSRVFGVPLANLGVFFYGLLFIFAALELVIFDQFLRRVLQVLSVIGIVSSLYFVLVQFFAIGAFCVYCLVSAIITLLVFVVAGLIEPINLKSVISRPQAKSLQMPPTT